MDSTHNTKSNRFGVILQWVSLIAILAAAIFIIDVTGVLRNTGSSAHKVTYRVDGSTSAGIVSYTQADGTPIGRFDTTIPWKKTISFHEPTTVVLIAGNPSQTGTLRCSLFIDGIEYDSEEVAAPKDRVSCAAVTP